MKFALVIVFTLFLAAVSTSYGQILDTSGEPIRPKVQYYIVPTQPGFGGGLIPFARTFSLETLCPQDIIQSPYPFIPGFPVTFVPQNSSSQDSIPDYVKLNIKFSVGFWYCSESKLWKAQYVAEQGGSLVSTGGKTGNSDSWFRIKKFGSAYKLVYCYTSTFCTDVGVYSDYLGLRRLVLGGEPLPVKFQKVYETTVSQNAIAM